MAARTRRPAGLGSASISNLRGAATRYIGLGILTAILVSGCSGKHWTKPGATVEDFNRDSHACGVEARRGVFIGPPVDRWVYRQCMSGRGYQRVEGGTWVGLRD